MNEQLATTVNLLHPRQVSELTDTKAKLERMLGAAPYIRDQLQDGGAIAQKQIQSINKVLEQAPEPISAAEMDAAVRLEAELRTDWLDGMPTQAEMRRNPPGATDKNAAWLNRHKTAVLRWKHLRRRLHASGVSEHRMADAGDISNVEMFRPHGGAGEMSMDNAQIPAKSTTHLPPPGAAPMAVMSPEQSQLLKSISPEAHAQMALVSNEQRANVLDLIDGLLAGVEDTPATPGTQTVSAPAEAPATPAPAAKKSGAKRKARGSYNESELGLLRAEAKSLGINCWQKSKVALKHEIAQRRG